MTRLVHRRVRSASSVDHLFHVFQNKFTPKQESNNQEECDRQFCYLILIQQCQPGGHFFSKFENLKLSSSRLNLTSQDSHTRFQLIFQVGGNKKHLVSGVLSTRLSQLSSQASYSMFSNESTESLNTPATGRSSAAFIGELPLNTCF